MNIQSSFITRGGEGGLIEGGIVLSSLEKGELIRWRGLIWEGGLIEDLYTVEVWLAESSWYMSYLIEVYDSIFIAS